MVAIGGRVGLAARHRHAGAVGEAVVGVDNRIALRLALPREPAHAVIDVVRHLAVRPGFALLVTVQIVGIGEGGNHRVPALIDKRDHEVCGVVGIRRREAALGVFQRDPVAVVVVGIPRNHRLPLLHLRQPVEAVIGIAERELHRAVPCEGKACAVARRVVGEALDDAVQFRLFHKAAPRVVAVGHRQHTVRVGQLLVRLGIAVGDALRDAIHRHRLGEDAVQRVIDIDGRVLIAVRLAHEPSHRVIDAGLHKVERIVRRQRVAARVHHFDDLAEAVIFAGGLCRAVRGIAEHAGVHRDLVAHGVVFVPRAVFAPVRLEEDRIRDAVPIVVAVFGLPPRLRFVRRAAQYLLFEDVSRSVIEVPRNRAGAPLKRRFLPDEASCRVVVKQCGVSLGIGRGDLVPERVVGREG